MVCAAQPRLPSIGAGAAKGFGVKDMDGLAWEWTLDFGTYAIAPDGALCRYFSSSARVGTRPLGVR